MSRPSAHDATPTLLLWLLSRFDELPPRRDGPSHLERQAEARLREYLDAVRGPAAGPATTGNPERKVREDP